MDIIEGAYFQKRVWELYQNDGKFLLILFTEKKNVHTNLQAQKIWNN